MAATVFISSISYLLADPLSEANLAIKAPSVGEYSDSERDSYLKLVGDESPGGAPRASGNKSAWEHTEHQFGFLPFATNTPTLSTNGLSIMPAHAIKANRKLTRIDIRLDKIRVYDYPGSGLHTVLFNFVAENSLTNATAGAESVTFSQSYDIQEQQGAGINGYPIFNGLNVGKSGIAFKCATVNVKNQNDTKALGFLKSGAAAKGLTLLTTAQPAIAPFVELTKGFAEMFLTRNENVKVQDFFLGLDFDDGAAFGARLQEGNYIVVQAPDGEFSFSQWIYKPSEGKLVKVGTNEPIPYNYVIFRVSKHSN